MEYLQLYLEFYKIKLKTIAQYRSSFFMTMFSKGMSYLANIVTIWIMISAFQTMGSWNAYEVLLLFGLNSAAYALAGSFFYHITTYLSKWVRDGTIDEILTKPLNPFLYLAARLFSTGYFGTMTVSLGIIVFSLLRLGVALSAGKILFLIAAILSGGLITGSMMLIFSVPSFWMVEISALRSLFFGSLSGYVEYPITIFHEAVQVLLTVVLPYAFVTFFPALFILGKADYSIFPAWFQFISPLVAAVLFTFAYKFWFYGLRRYDSTGT